MCIIPTGLHQYRPYRIHYKIHYRIQYRIHYRIDYMIHNRIHYRISLPGLLVQVDFHHRFTPRLLVHVDLSLPI